ncbi:MAG: PIN domain-containing protein [Mesorhizobium sp.]|uniref:type II toxin-antitoxin system VapC family toxin n=1 Tax=Mesorhizobium sp. TaxID=1871066 RepID=UPI000FE92E90|nr:type II toxin-antitoxin system VapC family toxin [Mesorhizobium sp.]RWL88902.1 MAG: PIN domain-containing protein [Mesorhizobium sp.]TJV68190.1 MAG: type II toxin-antitoxin system VapC family toxin [Mesorhizobium sp.]
MRSVIDASVAAAWFLPDEQNDAADRLMADLRSAPGLVPSLFWFETRNLFLMAERRGRLEAGGAALSMAQLRRLPLQDEGAGNDALVLAIASRRALSAYDASYLALAVQQAMPLATADRRMADAAALEGIAVLGPHGASATPLAEKP